MIPVLGRGSRVELESRRFRKRMTDRFIGLRTGLAEFGSYLFNTFKMFISLELANLVKWAILAKLGTHHGK